MSERRSLLRDRGGAAYVEFLIAFIPIFTLFLGLVQVSLVFGASLVVRHAAFRATRAAVVVLDDDPRYYLGEDRNRVSGRPAEPNDLLSRMDTGGGRTGTRTKLSRRAAIETAAALVLVPLRPAAGADSVAGSLGWSGRESAVRRTLDHLEVVVRQPPDPSRDDPDDGRGEAEMITVEVRYRYRCTVPVVASLVCRDRGTLTLTGVETLPNHRARMEYATGDWGTR